MNPNHPSLEDIAVLDTLLRKGDEVQQWLDLDAEQARYIERHPQTAAHVAGAEASNRKQGKSHAATESVPAFVNFVAKGAKDRGQKGWSATKLRRQLACVKFLGRDYLETLVAQPRRRGGLCDFINTIISQCSVGTPVRQAEREELVEAWLAEEPVARRKSDDQTTWVATLERIKMLIQSLNDREQDQLQPALRAYLDERDEARFG